MAVMFFVFVSIATLLLMWFSARSRVAAPTRLVMLGVWVAVVGLWYGLLNNLPSRDHGVVPLGNGALAETALRIAAVLVLGGVVTGLLVHDTATVTYVPPEHPRNVPPSV